MHPNKLISMALVIAIGLMPTVASAKTTVTIDRVKDKVVVKDGKIGKALKYKVKTVYATKAVKLYTSPKKGAKVAGTIEAEAPLTRIAKGKTYSVIRYDIGKRRYFFAKNSQLSTKKPIKAKYSASHFKRAGVIRWNGYRWTWYSQRVLPGGGLKIPGRHVDSHGYVCDKDDYICVASSTLKSGTVVDTPFGKKGKVYDSGCSKGTVDVYVNW